ncbi:hypothetical protein EDD27_7670 [Nonomuraea polychroma]|uniref:Uncharacterized protein n=1 Tax=Nonomuraea polychroma TaxID=46176 RepID=A0A438MGI8_9ACTN|nr:hypothetical protein [Nonomuraea polychroma]RVX44903.1 hypothetical protein EDD27_7670 [Nonomuraea polychroma]
MTPDEPRAVGDITLDGTPYLVLGRRKGRRDMEARRVVIHEDLHEPLWELSLHALERVRAGNARSYEPNAELELGEEYFLLDLDEIPEQPEKPSRGKKADLTPEDDNQDRTAALIRALRDVGVLDILDPHELPEFTPTLFYSVAWQQADDTWVHFIRKTNPRQVFKPGLKWLGYGDTLKRIADPAMVIDDLIDMILTADQLAAFSGQHLKTLFTDVHIVLQDVPKYVDTVAKILDEESIGITEDAKTALLAASKKRVSFAARLYRLQERLAEIRLDLNRLGKVMDLHTIDIGSLLDGEGKIHFQEDQAGLFLDVLDGRLFKDDWTGEPRRADRYSRWQSTSSS